MTTKTYKLLFIAPFGLALILGLIANYLNRTTSNSVIVHFDNSCRIEAELLRSTLELRGNAPYGHRGFKVEMLYSDASIDLEHYSEMIRKQELLALIEISKSDKVIFSIIANPTDNSAKAAYERMLTTLSLSEALPEFSQKSILVPTANIYINSPMPKIKRTSNSESNTRVPPENAENEIEANSKVAIRGLLRTILYFALIFAAQASINVVLQPLAAKIVEEKNQGDLISILLIPDMTSQYLLAKHITSLIVGGTLLLWYDTLISAIGLYLGIIQVPEVFCFLFFALLGMQLNTAIILSVGSYAKSSEHATQIASPYMYMNLLLGMTPMVMLSRPDSELTRYLALFPLTSYFAAPLRFFLANNASYLNLFVSATITLTAIAVTFIFNTRRYDVQTICSVNEGNDSKAALETANK